MADRPADVLRVQPHMVPTLRATFSSAVEQVEDVLANLGRGGYLPSPWLGDDVSSSVAAHYTRRAMDDPDSSYQALHQYRDELRRVHDTLQEMETAYLRTEAHTTDAFRPQA